MTKGTMRGSEGLEGVSERVLRVEEEEEDGIGVGGRLSTAMELLSDSSGIVSEVGDPTVLVVVFRELNRYIKR